MKHPHLHIAINSEVELRLTAETHAFYKLICGNPENHFLVIVANVEFWFSACICPLQELHTLNRVPTYTNNDFNACLFFSYFLENVPIVPGQAVN